MKKYLMIVFIFAIIAFVLTAHNSQAFAVTSGGIGAAIQNATLETGGKGTHVALAIIEETAGSTTLSANYSGGGNCCGLIVLNRTDKKFDGMFFARAPDNLENNLKVGA